MDNENADEEDIRAISSGDDEQEDRPPARRQKRLVSKLTDTIPKNASSSRSHAGPSTPSTMVSKKPSGSRAVSTGKRKRPATGPGTVSAALQSFQDSFGPSAVAASPSKAAPAKSTAKGEVAILLHLSKTRQAIAPRIVFWWRKAREARQVKMADWHPFRLYSNTRQDSCG